MELKQIHEDRAAAAAYLADALQGLYAGAPSPAPLVGGREAGMTRLRVFNVADYQARRNDVGPRAGASQLSPYIRHGCVSLRDAKRFALETIGASRATKFIQELAWRQFWQLQWERDGDHIFSDMETPKVPLGDEDEIPEDVLNADTGLNCMNSVSRSLHETGYVFNHGRMWMASYLVHHRKVRWQTGADWFYQYLLDGDPASNVLSWQWVASTFSHKPYIFNRENVEKYSRDPETGETFCTHCPAAHNGTCPFDFSYTELGQRLFGRSYDGDNGYAERGTKGNSSFRRGGVAPRRSSTRG